MLLICPTAQAEYFSQKDWTTQITLKCLQNLFFARETVSRPSAHYHRIHSQDCVLGGAQMTASKPHSLLRSTTYALLLLLGTQSSALARAGGFASDPPWNPAHIDGLPPEVRTSVLRMCKVKPSAAHYFATYLDSARIIKLHFEHFNCEGSQPYRAEGRCLHEEFVLSGSHYRLTKNYYGQCDD